jgi:hypothetical protein
MYSYHEGNELPPCPEWITGIATCHSDLCELSGRAEHVKYNGFGTREYMTWYVKVLIEDGKLTKDVSVTEMDKDAVDFKWLAEAKYPDILKTLLLNALKEYTEYSWRNWISDRREKEERKSNG